MKAKKYEPAEDAEFGIKPWMVWQVQEEVKPTNIEAAAAESFPQDSNITDDSSRTKDDIYNVNERGFFWKKCRQEPSLKKSRKPCQASSQLNIG
jgi:hypothetical protein